MSSNQNRSLVTQGKCLTCFYLTFRNKGESFICAKYNFEPKGAVESCPGFRPIAEGLGELIERMKAKGELPGWVGK